MDAETAYVFRHALLRDAAYQLQLPGQRAVLHGLALELIEAFCGGRPQESQEPLSKELQFPPHATDVFAVELAEHAIQADKAQPESDSGSRSDTLRKAHVNYLRRAAEIATRRFQHDSAFVSWKRMSESLSGQSKRDALRRAADAAWSGGQVAAARSAHSESIRLNAASGDRLFEAQAEGWLANIDARTGLVESAETSYLRLRKVFGELVQPLSEGNVLGNLGILYLETGRPQLAERVMIEGLECHRRAGARRAVGLGTGNLAAVYINLGRHDEAEPLVRMAIDIDREFGDLRSESTDLANLALIRERLGDLESAESLKVEALSLARRAGSWRSEGLVLNDLAGLYARTGRVKDAELAYSRAIDLLREVGDLRSEGQVRGNRAGLLAEQGRLDQARREFETALDLHRITRNSRLEGAHRCGFSILLLRLREIDAAREEWRKGESMLRQYGDLHSLETLTLQMRTCCASSGVAAFDGVL